MGEWITSWLRTRRCKKFRSRNYPVVKRRFTSQDLVLVRNLDTHQHSGWLISVDDAIAEWGKEVIARLDVI